MARDWIRLHIGLLDDDRFEAMPPDLVGGWTVTYLLLGREGGCVKDDAKLERLLTKQQWPDAGATVERLREAGWIVPCKDGITLRGFFDYQAVWRGPSDDAAAKAERNAKRPTTVAARRGASVERREEEREKKDAAPRANGAARVDGPPVSFKEAVAAAGFDPSRLLTDKRGTV